MNIVVDTNILISLLIKPDGAISELFEKVLSDHDLYISSYSLTEVNKHYKKLLKSSKLHPDELESLKFFILKQVTIVPADIIPEEIKDNAYELVHDIDVNDVIFIATAIFVNGILWTGDNKLSGELKTKKFKAVLSSTEIRKLL